MKRIGLILLALGWPLFVVGGASSGLKPSWVSSVQQWIASLLGIYSTDVALNSIWVGGMLIGLGLLLRRW